MPQFVTQPQSVDLCIKLYKELFVPLKIMLEGFFCDFHSTLHHRHVSHSGSLLQYQISATRGYLFHPLGVGWQYLRKKISTLQAGDGRVVIEMLMRRRTHHRNPYQAHYRNTFWTHPTNPYQAHYRRNHCINNIETNNQRCTI